MKPKGKVKALYITMSVLFGLYALSLLFPFVYMLLDCETNLPFFIGTLMTIPE